MDQEAPFGRWLHWRRKTLDLSQKELGRCVGCSPNHIRNIEADRRRPSKEIAARLATCLGIAEEDRMAFQRFARSEQGARDLGPAVLERSARDDHRSQPHAA